MHACTYYPYYPVSIPAWDTKWIFYTHLHLLFSFRFSDRMPFLFLYSLATHACMLLRRYCLFFPHPETEASGSGRGGNGGRAVNWIQSLCPEYRPWWCTVEFSTMQYSTIHEPYTTYSIHFLSFCWCITLPLSLFVYTFFYLPRFPYSGYNPLQPDYNVSLISLFFFPPSLSVCSFAFLTGGCMHAMPCRESTLLSRSQPTPPHPSFCVLGLNKIILIL